MNYIIRTTEHKGIVKGYIDRLPDRALGYKILIEPIRQTRSMNQNNYMWYIFEMIAEHTGEDKNRIHDYYIQKFLTIEREIFGQKYSFIRGTSGLNTKEFEDFMTKVRQDAQDELKICCPLPNELIEEG